MSVLMFGKLRRLFSTPPEKKASGESIEVLASQSAEYIAQAADELVSLLKSDGIQLGHRASSVRREVIAFYAGMAMRQTRQEPQMLDPAKIFVQKLKAQFDPINDLRQDRVYIHGKDGSMATGATQTNLLVLTIDDRIAFYDPGWEGNADPDAILPLMISAAHVLHGPSLAKKRLPEIEEELLAGSGKVKKIEYPDEKRDACVAEWFARIKEPARERMVKFLR
jgi:hypothetical protein